MVDLFPLQPSRILIVTRMMITRIIVADSRTIRGQSDTKSLGKGSGLNMRREMEQMDSVHQDRIIS
jgi:hypothetical protein